MASQSYLPCLLLLYTLFLSDVRGLCSDFKNCRSCLEHYSWSGEKCQWCPVDNKCHFPGSKYVNCTSVQNIVHPWKCRFYYHEYNPKLAYRLTKLSAVAYSPNASAYIRTALPCDDFVCVTQQFFTCPEELGQCSSYAAASHTTKEIIVAFAAWQNKSRDIKKALSEYSEAKTPFIFGGRVQSYFKTAYDIIWPRMRPYVYSLITENPSYKVRVTGHGYGGAVASMISTAIAFEGNTSLTNIALYTFGQPRVGSYSYSRIHDTLVKTSMRLVHFKDPYAHIPACWKAVYTGCRPSDYGPYHHGIEIFYKENMSTDTQYTKCLGIPPDEDNACSNGVIGQCLKDISKCIEDHKEYFGVPVRTWWQTQDLSSFKKDPKVCMTKVSFNSVERLSTSPAVISVLTSVCLLIGTY